MTALPANLARIIFTGLALLLELGHLGWEHFNGGVPSHHLLNRADLPAISNWWGALAIPVLTWFLIGRIQFRNTQREADGSDAPQRFPSVLAGFLAALAYGAAIALAFTMNSAAVSYIFLGVFAISLLVPTYRAEYVLGFVFGMTFTFGAVLPTIVASVVALFASVVHFVIRALRRLIHNNRAPAPAPGNLQ